MSQGRRAGLISLAGVALGFFTYLLAAAAGIAAVFALVPEIYLAIKLAGRRTSPGWPGRRSARVVWLRIDLRACLVAQLRLQN